MVASPYMMHICVLAPQHRRKISLATCLANFDHQQGIKQTLFIRIAKIDLINRTQKIPTIRISQGFGV